MRARTLHTDGEQRTVAIVLSTGDEAMACLKAFAEREHVTAAQVEGTAAAKPGRLRYFCSPHHQDSALFPIIAQLERAAGFTRDDTPAAQLEKLAALLGDSAAASDDLALIAELLSLPI